MSQIANGPRQIPPFNTDTFLCDSFYGTSLQFSDCTIAANSLPRGASDQPYHILNPQEYSHSSDLPFSVSHGACLISVDVSGPVVPTSMYYSPDEIRAMAGWVIQQCVSGREGMGGFVTKNLNNMLFYFALRTTAFTDSYPASSAFITLSVTGHTALMPKPGDFDPSVPIFISGWMYGLWAASLSQTSSLTGHYGDISLILRLKAAAMSRGGRNPWWSVTASNADEMTYACDADLGSPSTVDCAQLDYQVGAASDTLQLRPGNVKFLSSNTCNVAITSDTALTLTWAQIKAALDTLTNFCVLNPLKGSRGGRAYFGAQTLALSGRRRRKRNDVSGLNALPPGTNLTMFQQFEPWQSDPSVEVKTCTWQALQDRKTLSLCKNK